MTEKKMHKDEASFHSDLMKFLEYNRRLFPRSYLFETKVVRRDETSFAFNELSAKEERLLLQAKKLSIIQTHSDYGGTGTNCDGSVIGGAGLIFLKWVRPGNKTFYCIDIEDFITVRDMSKRKSLTEFMAEKIGMTYELYKIN